MPRIWCRSGDASWRRRVSLLPVYSSTAGHSRTFFTPFGGVSAVVIGRTWRLRAWYKLFTTTARVVSFYHRYPASLLGTDV